MSLAQMAERILKILHKKYPRIQGSDIEHLKIICRAEAKQDVGVPLQTFSEINFSSPLFLPDRSVKEYTHRTQFIIKVVYVCLRLDVDIFTVQDDGITILNIHNLVKVLSSARRRLLTEHIQMLKQYQHQNLDDNYLSYHASFVPKVRLVERIIYVLEKLVSQGVLRYQDNLLTLILPYHYHFNEYIEDYNS